MHNHERIEGFFLSKEEAEFYVWEKMKSENSNDWSFSHGSYFIQDIPALTISKEGKNYKKFIGEKLDMVRAKIKSEQDCIESDKSAIDLLKKEEEYYSSIKI